MQHVRAPVPLRLNCMRVLLIRFKFILNFKNSLKTTEQKATNVQINLKMCKIAVELVFPVGVRAGTETCELRGCVISKISEFILI